MQRVFAMYKLKQGVKIEEYRKWSINGDQKILPSQPDVHNFEVYEIIKAEDGDSPYTIIEIVDVDSWKSWEKVLSSEPMKKIVETWGEYGDESTLKVVLSNKVD